MKIKLLDNEYYEKELIVGDVFEINKQTDVVIVSPTESYYKIKGKNLSMFGYAWLDCNRFESVEEENKP